MLGRFLEYSIASPDVRESLNFYAKLGFSQAEVGEAWGHPYAVVTDGRTYLGLHHEDFPGPSITFVKPDLLRHLDALEKFGIEFEFRRLGNDVFNEVGWRDPSGHLIRLVEARTFSPAKRLGTEMSLCGYFLEFALPTADREAAKIYWEQFGFVGMDAPDATLPHIACTSDTVEVGLYDPAQLRAPTLLYEAADIGAARARLAEAGLVPNGRLPPALRSASAAALVAPEGTPILLIPAEE